MIISTSSLAAPFLLVSDDEVRHSNLNKFAFQAKFAPVPGAPTIDLLAPAMDGVISSPTPIKLKFEAKSPSIIKPDTFRVFYGSFQIDITERLLGASKVERGGFYVAEAALPKGNHKLMLNIQDTDGRVGQKIIEFEVK